MDLALGIFLSVQEGGQVVVQPAAAVVAGIHDQGIAGSVLAEGLGIDLAEAGGVHPAHVDIAHAAAGKLLHALLVIAYPPLIEGLGIIGAGGDEYILLLAIRLDAEDDALAVLAGEGPVPGSAGLDGLAFDGEDQIPLLHFGSGGLEQAVGKELLDLESLAGIALVEDDSEMAGAHRGTAVAGSGVRSVKFAQHFGEQLAECEVVGDIREELAVVFAHLCPVDSVHIGHIPLLLDQPPAVLEDVFALLVGEEFEFPAETDGLGGEVLGIGLGNAQTGDDEEVLAVAGRGEEAAEALLHDLDAAVLEIDADEVPALLELDAVVDLLAIGGEIVITQAAGIAGKADYAVETSFEFEFHLLGLLGLGAVGSFLLLFLLLLRSLLVILQQVLDLVEIVATGEFVVGLLVEEHNEDVAFRAPAAVAAVAELVGGEGHSLAAQGPLEIIVGISAQGEVGKLAGLHLYKADIIVVHTLVPLIVG